MLNVSRGYAPKHMQQQFAHVFLLFSLSHAHASSGFSAPRWLYFVSVLHKLVVLSSSDYICFKHSQLHFYYCRMLCFLRLLYPYFFCFFFALLLFKQMLAVTACQCQQATNPHALTHTHTRIFVLPAAAVAMTLKKVPHSQLVATKWRKILIHAKNKHKHTSNSVRRHFRRSTATKYAFVFLYLHCLFTFSTYWFVIVWYVCAPKVMPHYVFSYSKH